MCILCISALDKVCNSAYLRKKTQRIWSPLYCVISGNSNVTYIPVFIRFIQNSLKYASKTKSQALIFFGIKYLKTFIDQIEERLRNKPHQASNILFWDHTRVIERQPEAPCTCFSSSTSWATYSWKALRRSPVYIYISTYLHLYKPYLPSILLFLSTYYYRYIY